MLHSTLSWATRHLYVCLLLSLLLSACGADTTAIQQHLLGRWEEQSYATLANDGSATPITPSGITLTFLSDGTYVRLYHVGPAEYRGTYRVIDEHHLRIDITQTPNNKDGPKEIQEFYVDGATLTIITPGTKEVYIRQR
jgi:hypothetical protein